MIKNRYKYAGKVGWWGGGVVTSQDIKLQWLMRLAECVRWQAVASQPDTERRISGHHITRDNMSPQQGSNHNINHAKQIWSTTTTHQYHWLPVNQQYTISSNIYFCWGRRRFGREINFLQRNWTFSNLIISTWNHFLLTRSLFERIYSAPGSFLP